MYVGTPAPALKAHVPLALAARSPPCSTPQTMNEELFLPAAAARLGMSWHVVYRLALSGHLGPLERRDNRWVLTMAGIEAYEQAQRRAARGRGDAV